MPKHTLDQPVHCTAASSRGFTLVELILVMGVMVMLFAIAAPGIKSIINTNNLQGAARLVGSAVASARAQAPLSPPMDYSTYQGSAIIFTPQHEIRFTRHQEKDYHSNDNEYVSDGSDNPFYETSSTTGYKHGYLDIENLDPLRWSNSVGIVGLFRNGPDLILLTPPFAIRFDGQGRMDTVGRSNDGRAVFYDGNYDDQYVESRDRSKPYDGSTNYNVDAWDPSREEAYIGEDPNDLDSPKFPNIHTESGLYKLPFERLETVIGVVIFDRAELDSFAESLTPPVSSPLDSDGAGLIDKALPAAGDPSNSIHSWILNNGRVLFFNRYTGSVLDQDIE